MSVEILPIGYYNVTVTTSEAYTIEVVTPEAYTVTVVEPESYNITTAGTQGPPGPQGPAGPAGPNEVTTATSTDITGLLKGNGTNIEQAVDGTDYNTQDLQSVLSNGSISDIDITIKNNSTDDYSIIQPTAIGTENAGSGSYAYLSYDGYLGLSNGNVESQLKNTDVTNGVTLEFPDKPTGTYTIATTDDVPNAVTSVSATSPITSSGGNTPTISTSMSTNKLIGRSTAGTGVMEEISIGTGLTLSGGTLSSGAGGLKSGTATAAVTDVYTTTIAGVTAYNTNDAYVIKFNTANSDGATININSLGAVQLVKNNNVIITGGDIQVGQEFIIIYDGTNFQMLGIAPNQMFAYVTNADSVTINKGQPVYAFGATGDRMSVKLANNTSEATSSKTVGLVFSSSIAPNGLGYVITQGVLQNISTAAFSAGDTLYVGASAGSLTKTMPTAPNHLTRIGIVERANAGNGQIYVMVQNGFQLDELSDVDITSVLPVNNDVLTYITGTNNLWKPRSVTTILGYTPPRTYSQNTTPTGTGTSAIPSGSLWFHSDTGIQYTYYYDGNTYQWTQETLPLGPQGPQGANGTNIVNGSTATTFTGLLKGNGSVISATTVLTEIGFTPENVANKENTTLDTSSTKYPTNNLVKTSLDSFADDVDYAIMTNQRILFNF